MKQGNFEFKNYCIMDKMIWPDNDDWILKLIKEAEKKRELDNTIGNMVS